MSLARNLEIVRDRILQAAKRAGRDIEEIDFLAISKFISIDAMIQAYQLGVVSFGESYVQEARSKFESFKACDPKVDFHLIGKLQRNKVKRALGVFSLIQSVDRPELALEIANAARALSLRQKILIQVNVSKETSKGGVQFDAVRELVDLILNHDALEFLGLMSIGSPLFDEQGASNEAIVRQEFASLRELLFSLRDEFSLPLPILSMGTSEDYELAIEEGATLVRIGSALFGERAST